MGVKFALKDILCSRVYSATVVTEVKALNAHLFQPKRSLLSCGRITVD